MVRLANARSGAIRPDRSLPAWRTVLAVVAHPDDETFGLGAILDQMTRTGTAVHVLCYTRGEASTLNQPVQELGDVRTAELLEASRELGIASVTLLDHPDGHLAAIEVPELARQVADLVARNDPDGLLVFDDTGITGHPDHQAATRAATVAAAAAGLPVLAWTLPAAVANQLRAETGQAFTGRLPDQIDMCVRVDRTRQRRAALLHASQISPSAVLWRRLQLQSGCEHLRWLARAIPPPSSPDAYPGLVP